MGFNSGIKGLIHMHVLIFVLELKMFNFAYKLSVSQRIIIDFLIDKKLNLFFKINT
jgi:hypothetical protein